ncbi:hypothetical protein ACFMH7_004764 [Escherichia coli O8:H49]
MTNIEKQKKSDINYSTQTGSYQIFVAGSQVKCGRQQKSVEKPRPECEWGGKAEKLEGL